MKLRPKDVAKRYGISLPTVYRWVRYHGLPAVRIGRRILRFNLEDLSLWEDQIKYEQEFAKRLKPGWKPSPETKVLQSPAEARRGK